MEVVKHWEKSREEETNRKERLINLIQHYENDITYRNLDIDPDDIHKFDMKKFINKIEEVEIEGGEGKNVNGCSNSTTYYTGMLKDNILFMIWYNADDIQGVDIEIHVTKDTEKFMESFLEYCI
jgi:hypothetical protein